MDRRRFLSCSVATAATLGGCLGREGGGTPDATPERPTTRADRGDGQGRTGTMRPTEQHLVLVNVDDERHRVRVTVSADDDRDVLDRTADLAADERRPLALDLDEPETYTVSATVDGDATETWSIHISDYAIQEGLNGFVEVDDGRPDIYWEE